MTPKTLSFSGNELISDILEKMPPASEILAAHGIGCAGCAINAFETLRDGVLGHGFSQNDFDNILADLNDAAAEMGIPESGATKSAGKKVVLTHAAADKILELAEKFKAEKKISGENWGFKVEVLSAAIGEPSYFLDFLSKPDPNDQIIKSKNIALFLDPESEKFLKDCQIDFGANQSGEIGFKIDRN